MVSRLDASVGRIVHALGNKGMLRNSLILFLTDNGAAPIGKFRNYGSNYPLRGVSILNYVCQVPKNLCILTTNYIYHD